MNDYQFRPNVQLPAPTFRPEEPGGIVQIPISEAIQQLRSDLREAVVEGKDQDIVFTPNEVEIELSVNFTVEAKAGGGFKLLALLDISTEAKVGRESAHKIKLSFSIADRDGKPLKVRSDQIPRDLPTPR